MTTRLYKTTVEKARQRFNVTLKDEDLEFRSTSNDRNNAMLGESSKFAQALRALSKDLSAIDNCVSAGLSTVRRVLEAPLPRLYEDGAGGAFPATRELMPVGAGVHTDALLASSHDVKERLQNEVLGPIEQWLNAYKVIKERNTKLEEVRLSLDVKRRSFLNYKAKYLKLVDKVKSKPEEQEKIYNLAQTEEDKMNRLIMRYMEMEEEVYQALLALVNDTVHLRDYVFAALFILKRSFAGATWAFQEAYPGLVVDDVPQGIMEVPKADPVDINSRFAYLTPTGIAAAKEGPAWRRTGTSTRATGDIQAMPSTDGELKA